MRKESRKFGHHPRSVRGKSNHVLTVRHSTRSGAEVMKHNHPMKNIAHTIRVALATLALGATHERLSAQTCPDTAISPTAADAPSGKSACGAPSVTPAAAPAITAEEWKRTDSLREQIKAIQAKGAQVTREDLDRLEMSRRELAAFYERAIFLKGLSAEERARLGMNLHHRDDMPTRAVCTDARPRREFSGTTPEGSPEIQKGTPSEWARYGRDAEDLSEAEDMRLWMSKSRATLKRFKGKFEDRTPTAMRAVTNKTP